MTNEQKAARLEAMALGKQCHAKDWSSGAQMHKMFADASLLLEGATALRDIDNARWREAEGEFGNLIAVHKGVFLKIYIPLGRGRRWRWKAWSEARFNLGVAETLEAAQAAAVAWVDSQEGK